MRKALFYQGFTVNQTAHQSHLVYRVYVPKNIKLIEIHFSYHPILETNKDSIRGAVRREGLDDSIVQEDTELRNLLTMSVNDPHKYRGSHHFFCQEQVIEIGSDTATEGFWAGEIQEGYWEFIVNCHGVFSKVVHGQLEVFGVSTQVDDKEIPLSPLEEIEFVQMKKQRQSDREQTYRVKKVELHAHTVHSDATQTTEQLLEQTEKEDIDWLAITDHNTTSALREAEKMQSLEKRVNLLHGIEYTTYDGHFLVHGDLEAITYDWTEISKTSIPDFLKKLKEKDVYLTIAHPFDIGNPFCTGCRWEYVLDNLAFVDAIEVWNGTNPHQSISNEDAYYKWTELLAQGYEIAASSGRDWHQLYPNEEIAYTYVLLPEETAAEKDVLAALSLGRTYCSIRPQIDFKLNDLYLLGDRIEVKTDELKISLRITDLLKDDEIRIYSDRSLLYEEQFITNRDWQKVLKMQNDGYKLLRVEINNKRNERIAFTNPIYIDCY
ncbi:CehA/McbA family metallohydrolase [Oceanobacillus rekensis]|uniref:CehA/McbA family metallohydrolase n=1 Tax=Oceanobacillus rekensis TaxID=937927 RepID=UPI000B43840A|nr:CehA/McbA family metallohydrolase [Oceanobacillus rekensis]